MGQILRRLLHLPAAMLQMTFSVRGVLFVYVCLLLLCFGLGTFGDPEGDEKIDKMYRVCFTYPSNFIRRALCTVFGDRGGHAWDWLYDYVFEQNNCLVQVMYVVLVGGINASTMYVRAEELLTHEEYGGIAILVVLPSICFIFFVFCSLEDPGAILDQEDLLQAEVYWRRDMGKHPFKICRTDKWVRPPRSRHCSRCGVCVMKHDHHCPWIGNCVGPLNYKWFFGFLVSNSLMCTIYSVWMIRYLFDFLTERNLWNATFRTVTGERRPVTYLRLFEYVFSVHLTLMVNLAAAMLFAVACWILTAQHSVVIWRNRTVAECFNYGLRLRSNDWPYSKGRLGNIKEALSLSKETLVKSLNDTRLELGDEEFRRVYIAPILAFIDENNKSAAMAEGEGSEYESEMSYYEYDELVTETRPGNEGLDRVNEGGKESATVTKLSSVRCRKAR